MARYCVIGEEAFNRIWFDDLGFQEGGRLKAREHARTLMGKSNGRTKELLVVKVVDVIRLSEPPINIFPEAD